jgi:hypothetical protein
MNAKRFLARIRATGLVMRFSIVGVSLSLLIAGGLASIIEAQLTDLLLTSVGARAADQVDHLGLTGYVTADDFAAPHTPERLASIATRLDTIFANMHADGSGVIRLQMFAADGVILYSDLPSKRGETVDLSAEDHLVEALDGHGESEVSDLDGPENSELKDLYHQALEVYVPVDFDGQVVGASEV